MFVSPDGLACTDPGKTVTSCSAGGQKEMSSAELEQELQGIDKSWDLIPYLEVFRARLDGPWAALYGGWQPGPWQGVGTRFSMRSLPT